MIPVCAGDWVVLRVVDVDGIGGLTAVEMVKVRQSDERGAAELAANWSGDRGADTFCADGDVDAPRF